jgi:hypothetical protein
VGGGAHRVAPSSILGSTYSELTPSHCLDYKQLEAPGDFDLAVERRDWDGSYGTNLGT